jgi:hypothetical protein
MMHAAESNFGPEVGSATPGSRRAATGVRNDRGARPQTVEDHDRRSCYRRPLTWCFSRVFPVLNTTQLLAKNARADLARRKPGVQIPSPPPQHCRSERRRATIGGALVVPGAAWGHTGATAGLPAQPNDGGLGSWTGGTLEHVQAVMECGVGLRVQVAVPV